MKSLSISELRNRLPSVIKRVEQTNETVVISRHGKPVAGIVPIRATQSAENLHPLRGMKITLDADFDQPMPEFWQALSVAEEREEYSVEPKQSCRRERVKAKRKKAKTSE